MLIRQPRLWLTFQWHKIFYPQVQARARVCFKHLFSADQNCETCSVCFSYITKKSLPLLNQCTVCKSYQGRLHQYWRIPKVSFVLIGYLSEVIFYLSRRCDSEAISGAGSWSANGYCVVDVNGGLPWKGALTTQMYMIRCVRMQWGLGSNTADGGPLWQCPTTNRARHRKLNLPY